MTQKEAFAILKTGANVFVTGEPGSGKTYLINQYVSYLREHGIEPAITASTGIAATHIGGMTIHSWSGIGIKRELSEYDLDYLSQREKLVKRITKARVLVIDEISMLDARTLSLVELVCRTIRQNDAPFGGLQTVFVGDFFQLPPVSKDGVAQFAFESDVWKSARPIVCYLAEQHRQEDLLFLKLLGAVRAQSVTEDMLAVLSGRVVTSFENSNYPKLLSHNVDVDRMNAKELLKLKSDARTFSMQSKGNTLLVGALKNGCLSPETLVLKEGAEVMFTKNNFEKGFANGTLGLVKGFSSNGCPIIKTRGGASFEVAPQEWTIEEGGKILASIVQLPLRLAWAITIHKSQGMSLDAALIDLSSTFEYGQGYVALSRVRSLSGLHLLGYNERALMVHPEISLSDKTFRNYSGEAKAAFGAIPEKELDQAQRDFIFRSGGKIKRHGAQPKGKITWNERLKKMRTKYPNAYRSWTDADDVKLTELYQEGAQTRQLSEKLGRHPGAIRSRLLTLGLIE